MTRCYISGEFRARSTTGIANIVELSKRNEPLFGLFAWVSRPLLLKGQRDESRSMKTLTWSGKSASYEAASPRRQNGGVPFLDSRRSELHASLRQIVEEAPVLRYIFGVTFVRRRQSKPWRLFHNFSGFSARFAVAACL